MALLPWSGVVTSIQPRILLMRSFDQSQHGYHGYVLQLEGRVGDEERPFSIAIGPKSQEKHLFEVGDRVRGEASTLVVVQA